MHILNVWRKIRIYDEYSDANFKFKLLSKIRFYEEVFRNCSPSYYNVFLSLIYYQVTK